MRLLITGAWPQALDYLHELSKKHEIHFLKNEKDPLPCDPSWVEGIIGNGVFLYHQIEQFVNLKYVQLTSAGYDRVPMNYIKEHCIEIHNARGVYSIPMAEYALSGVLTLYKKSPFFFDNQNSHKWEKNRDLKELFGRIVCIIGCGSVGTECAKRFQAMGCDITGIDPVVQYNSFFSRILSPDEIKEVLEKADIVILTIPLTDDTFHFFNKELFAAMKKDSVLVNIARGALIDSDAMIYALQTKLFGAVLDVFDEEPLPKTSQLWDMKNVVITPHNSFVGDGNNKRLSTLILETINKKID